MITSEQVADLREGDVVVAHHVAWPKESFIRGELYRRGGPGLHCCGFEVATPDGRVWTPSFWDEFTVVSRAPRPLYVNHPRTEFVTGDVVGEDGVGVHPKSVWLVNAEGEDGTAWFVNTDCEWIPRGFLPDRLRLLVDGETGQVVP